MQSYISIPSVDQISLAKQIESENRDFDGPALSDRDEKVLTRKEELLESYKLLFFEKNSDSHKNFTVKRHREITRNLFSNGMDGFR